MKYWEIHDPYYGLIKGETEMLAKNTYHTCICELEGDEECTEITEDKALELYRQGCAAELKANPNYDVEQNFRECPTTYPLVVDGTLL